MHGYGGFTWQATRQLKILSKAGYDLIALDFHYILRSHNPDDLIGLMDEVDDFFKAEKLIRRDLVIVGISLGGLVGYNLMRRHTELTKLIIITGGDISHLPSKKSLQKHWKMTQKQLADRWKSVNMYTPYGEIKNRHVIMMLPVRDKMIDPKEVIGELKLHQPLNDIKLITTKGGHFRTIITETVLFPERILPLIQDLERL